MSFFDNARAGAADFDAFDALGLAAIAILQIDMQDYGAMNYAATHRKSRYEKHKTFL
jgi:hypothetical protein